MNLHKNNLLGIQKSFIDIISIYDSFLTSRLDISEFNNNIEYVLLRSS